MTYTIDAILLATLISVDDPHADAWDAIQWSRDMVRDYVLRGIAHAVTDDVGRPVVDALPPRYGACDACGGTVTERDQGVCGACLCPPTLRAVS